MIAKIMAIDYGLKRVGVAIGNNLTQHAEPLCTLENHSDSDLLKELHKLITEWQPNKLLMGVPFNPSPYPNLENDSSRQSGSFLNRIEKPSIQPQNTHSKNINSREKLQQKIKVFAAQLSERVDLPIEFVDESFSSREAERVLKQNRKAGNRNKRVQKKDIDKAAACVILQRWLDAQ